MKTTFWCLWFVFGLPTLFAETLVVLLPVRYILTVLHHERESVLASALFGAALGTVFSSFAHVYNDNPGAWCSAYMATLSFYCGHVLVGWLVYLGFTARWPLYDHWACFRSQFASYKAASATAPPAAPPKAPTTTPRFALAHLSSGGYCGLTLGFIISAFSVLSTQPVADSPALVEWCRPAPHVHMYMVCLPVFAIGVLKNMAELDHVVPWPVLAFATKHLKGSRRARRPFLYASASTTTSDGVTIPPPTDSSSDMERAPTTAVPPTVTSEDDIRRVQQGYLLAEDSD